MTRDEQFFYDNAAWNYDPKTETKEVGRERCAIALAKAEEHARNEGWMFEWITEDCIGCDCCDKDCPCCQHIPGHSKACLLWDNGDTPELLSSLGSICCPTREYRRVVEAELALDAMPKETKANS